MPPPDAIAPSGARDTLGLILTTSSMSASAFRAPLFVARLASHTWWILLIAALALLWLATARRIGRVDALTNSPTWSVDAPPRDVASPTGYAQGQRKLIVPGHHNPSFWWIMEAQQAARQGSLRLRHIDYDAPPAGRDIRRTSPYRWWLIAIGWLRGFMSGEPLGFAIERGALVADPLLLALLLVVGAGYSARYLGSFAAIGFVVGGIAVFPLAANFQPGAPDPHSLAWILAVGSVLPLLAGFRQQVAGPGSRAHFVAAGIFGGLGFWNDATSQAPVLLAIFLGALGYEFIRSRGAGPTPATRSNWRAWAGAGAFTTFAASVFEFAPSHFSWSLDSVSPIHAITWWGLGEALHAAGTWFREGRTGFRPRSLVGLAGAGLAIAAWPVVAMMSGSGTLLASDFYAQELANHPGAGFARNLSVWLNRAGDTGAKWATLLPCVILIVLLGRIFRGKIDREARGHLVFVLSTLFFAALLATRQLRWWNLFDVFTLVALAAFFAGTEGTVMRERGKILGTMLLVLPGLLVGFPPPVREKEVTETSPQEAQELIERDFSYWLGRRGGAEPNVLFSTPVFSGAVAYFGGFAVVDSSDGGNKTGYLTAVRIASATTAQEVSILLQARGITHVALPLWDPALDQLVRIGLSLPAEQPLPQNAFSVALRQWDIPLWMRPMDYLIPKTAAYQGFEVRAFALQPEQEPDLGLSRLADFFVQRGQLREAQSVRKSLEEYPRSVAALGAIATVDLALGDHGGLQESLKNLIPHLSRRSARDLPADRRISLATLFLQTKQVELAREQLTACFEDLDSGTLRTMTPASVVNLLALSRSLEISFPQQELKGVAMELIPPSVRGRLTAK